MTKFKALMGISISFVFIILIISIFFPYVLAFALPIIVPLSAFLIFRIKTYFSITPIAIFLILNLVLNFNYIFLIATIIFSVSVFGAVLAFRFKTFNKNLLVTSIFVLLALAIVFSGFFIMTDSSPADAIPNQIEQSTNLELIQRARNGYIKYWKSENINLPKEEFDKKYAEFVGTMTDSDALKFLASDVKWFLYRNIPVIIMGALSLITICSSIISTGLGCMFKKEKEKTNIFFNKTNLDFENGFESKIPDGYFLPVFITIILFMFLGKYYTVCNVIYRTFYQSFLFIPFSIFGILACIKVVYKSKNPLILVIIVGMVFLAGKNFFMWVGILDYAIKKLDLLEINDDMFK